MEGGAADPYLPHCFEDDHTVAYTGTHDNDTTLGWYRAAAEKARDYFRRYMNVSGDNPSWDLIRLLFSSSAKWVVAPVQDIMGLGGDDRMNLPGTAEGNWRFRFTKDMLTDGAAYNLRYLSEMFGRNEDDNGES
jgi:4-alpha-glucanotransferase